MKLEAFSACLILLFAFSPGFLHAQKQPSKNLVYVDKQGVLRYTSGNAEAAFFGVNYTVPFAYGYRSHKALNVDLEKSIDNDVYHFARLGFDAFRVHVWDTEISDTAGNLLNNEHLRLFDYLIARLKQRGIKMLITPIAFWGSGYPEHDASTPGFSHKYGKQKALVNDTAIAAQENYLKQFFAHVNPYTRLTYGADPDVIAMEINNEPHHSGPKEKVIEYINRMVTAARSTGWTKPVFYNISESPAYADAVAKANIEGVSFQWYPTGLVANRTLQGNYLPNVDDYKIPFGDTIPQYRNKARMVYEFDAGDVMQPVMYPAMARSFRTAGFRWATQFAYDPLATAYANTEYQTHYVNLAYTPSKAISLMIASKAFHKLPRLKNYGTYPADSVFDAFRVSYKSQLCEMNTPEEFYYSNTTATQPINTFTLQHIAGVGSSPVVTYSGTGAYFLDKIGESKWRLEVMPDAILIRDPFERASPRKPVTYISWQNQNMQILLPGLQSNFLITAINDGHHFGDTAENNSFTIHPGTYIISNKPVDKSTLSAAAKEFVAPPPSARETLVIHTPLPEVSSGIAFAINAKIIGANPSDKITMEVRNSSNKWRTVSLAKQSAYEYNAVIPVDMLTPGVINYRIIIQRLNGKFIVFPGGHEGNPYAWDAFENETWQTFVASQNSAIEIFNPNADRTTINVYNPDWRSNSITYTSAFNPKQLVLKAVMNNPTGSNLLGWQSYFAHKIEGRKTELPDVAKLVIKGQADRPTKIKIALINADGSAYAAYTTLNTNGGLIEIPVAAFKRDSSLLLPRPYPGFLPRWFTGSADASFRLHDAEKLGLTFGYDLQPEPNNAASIEIESIWLQK